MKRSFVLLTVLLLVGALGCSEEPNPVQPGATIDPLTEAPPESGVVTRDGFPIGVTWVDFDSGLRVILGADMSEFCAGIVNFDIIPYQDVNLADDRILEIGRGDVQVTVWDFLPFDCDLFTTVAPAASGRADLASTDNDLFGNEPDQTYANAWGWMAHGTLTRADGSPAQFSGHIRNKFSNSGGFASNAKVMLQKTSRRPTK